MLLEVVTRRSQTLSILSWEEKNIGYCMRKSRFHPALTNRNRLLQRCLLFIYIVKTNLSQRVKVLSTVSQKGGNKKKRNRQGQRFDGWSGFCLRRMDLFLRWSAIQRTRLHRPWNTTTKKSIHQLLLEREKDVGVIELMFLFASGQSIQPCQIRPSYLYI